MPSSEPGDVVLQMQELFAEITELEIEGILVQEELLAELDDHSTE